MYDIICRNPKQSALPQRINSFIHIFFMTAHSAFTCSKSTTETLEQGVKGVQS